ncbi:MAG TPA: 50S ribosomal protein L13 [archaeon]|nr:50S ribosomal protein L13 [archaeon]
MIVNAEGQVLGRISSQIAKKILSGEEVTVVNVEKAVISGRPEVSHGYYLGKRQRGDAHKGPFYPRYPDKLFTRVIRGMVPYKKPKGRDAMKRLKVFVGNPENLNAEKIAKSKDELTTKYTTLEQVCKALGAKI